MSKTIINTPLNINLEFNLAPFYKRFLAWLVDVFIYICYFKIIYLITSPLFHKVNVEGTANASWLQLIVCLPVAFYPLVCEYTMKGQTIGKKLLKIKVINQTGGNATLGQYMLRWMIRVGDFYLVIIIILLIYLAAMGFEMMFFASFIILLAGADFFCMLLQKNRQRLGDIAAGTILINTKTQHVLNQTIFMEVEDNYVAQYPEVMNLSDRDLNTLKHILNSLHKKYDTHLANQTAQKIEQVLHITSKHEPAAFIEIMLKDYNYLSTR